MSDLPEMIEYEKWPKHPRTSPWAVHYMLNNPTATIEDMQAAFPLYAPKTISSQHGRLRYKMYGIEFKHNSRTAGKKPKAKKEKKTKAPKVAHDPAHFQKSLANLTNITRATFIPADQAGLNEKGNKRHVNLTTAQQDAENQDIELAEDWVAWLKCVENHPKSDRLVDFNAWVSKPHRKEKLMRRIEAFKKIHEQLMFAMDCLFDVDLSQTPAANDDSQSHETILKQDTQACSL